MTGWFVYLTMMCAGSATTERQELFYKTKERAVEIQGFAESGQLAAELFPKCKIISTTIAEGDPKTMGKE